MPETTPAPHPSPDTAPRFDLEYELASDIPPRELWANDRDSVFYFDNVVRLVFETATRGAAGRLLDAGSGDGQHLWQYEQRAPALQAVGVEISRPLLEQARDGLRSVGVRPLLARGAAERLPFAAASFDRVVCQGSLDHFAQPRAFFEESARVLRPGGKLVVALQNFDSASCRLARASYACRGRLRLRRDDPTGAPRPYWQIPPNHTFRGNLRVLRAFAPPELRLERAFGASMFWLLPMWRRVIQRVPARAAGVMLRGADQAARRAPSLADMMICVWVRR